MTAICVKSMTVSAPRQEGPQARRRLTKLFANNMLPPERGLGGMFLALLVGQPSRVIRRQRPLGKEEAVMKWSALALAAVAALAIGAAPAWAGHPHRGGAHGSPRGGVYFGVPYGGYGRSSFYGNPYYRPPYYGPHYGPSHYRIPIYTYPRHRPHPYGCGCPACRAYGRAGSPYGGGGIGIHTGNFGFHIRF